MCKVLQGTQRLARPKLYSLGAYSKSTLYDINGSMSYKYKMLPLLPKNKTFKAIYNLKFRRLKTRFCLNGFYTTHSKTCFEQSLAKQLVK